MAFVGIFLLRIADLAIYLASLQQIVVSIYAHYVAFVEYYYLVGVFDRRSPLGYDYLSGIFGKIFIERLSQSKVCGKVQSAHTVVKYHDFGIAYERAGNGQSLTLTAREVFTFLLYGSVQALGFLHDEVVSLRSLEGADYLVVGSVFFSPLHVGADCYAEKHCKLGH